MNPALGMSSAAYSLRSVMAMIRIEPVVTSFWDPVQWFDDL